jgi:S-adenosylmethionine:tRNA ribosyltransferase-isomerase
MRPQDINIKDYNYELPDEKIAKFPLEQRDASKLLQYKAGIISDHSFKEIPTLLPANSLLVFNNTRVIHARLLFNRATGAQIEVFCIEPLDHLDYQLAFTSRGASSWKCMIGNAKRWKVGEVLSKTIQTPHGKTILSVTTNGKHGDLFIVHFSWDNTELAFAEVLHHAGVLPLPPYLNRESEEKDEERYQTIYAKEQGSVAAPTAGLHFTDAVMENLKTKGIEQTEVTLHVGAGTFKPVKTDRLQDHEMHEETLFVSRETIEKIAHSLASSKPIAAVGTTSARTLESLYWHGIKLLAGDHSNTVSINQWDPYQLENTIPAKDSFEAILSRMKQQGETTLQGSTQIILAPSYQFKVVDILITNFHQPENTLILLIAAFVGNDWRRIYQHALDDGYRFLSFGDSSILFGKS